MTRTTYFYLDPSWPLADPALRFEEIEFKPQLFFYDHGLWQTALKLKSLIENSDSMHRQYAEALGIVLTHEVVRINGWRCTPRGRQSWRPCGLAAKAGGRPYRGACRRRHPARDPRRSGPAEPVPFLPSFKHSFGMPPRRYHANRRIERAKQLLANRELSVTTIALDVGFSDTSTFTAAFHRLTGQTPSRYRRNLG